MEYKNTSQFIKQIKENRPEILIKEIPRWVLNSLQFFGNILTFKSIDNNIETITYSDKDSLHKISELGEKIVK